MGSKPSLGEATSLPAPGASLGIDSRIFLVSLGEATLCLRQNTASPRLAILWERTCPQAHAWG